MLFSPSSSGALLIPRLALLFVAEEKGDSEWLSLAVAARSAAKSARPDVTAASAKESFSVSQEA
jgi:hypothetical protein